jgi:hypothetical protein
LEAEKDAQWISLSRSKKVPTFAYIDQWINEVQRFVPDNLPDYFWTIDDRPFPKLRDALGSRIAVAAVGSPALNELKSFKTDPLSWTKTFFVTEPTSPEYYEKHGINDLLALRALISHSHLITQPIHIVLHPMDQAERISKFLKGFGSEIQGKFVLTNKTRTDVFRTAQHVFGMRSFLLYECSLLGIPATSIQIGRLSLSDLTDDRRLIEVATTDSALQLRLSKLEMISRESATTTISNRWTEELTLILKNSLRKT